MAKKMTSLASEFQGMSKSADDKGLASLAQESKQARPAVTAKVNRNRKVVQESTHK